MKTLLVVDDDVTFRDLVHRSADPAEYHVLTAPDGVEGLALLEKNIPDIILLDINMPRMGGIEFLRKAREQGVQAPVIISSNDSSLETISEGTALGIRGYIVKSGESMQTIFQTIKQFVQ